MSIQNRQYVTFRLGPEKYGVIVTKAREILDLVQITKIPRVAKEMLGVFNLRGQVVPVIDLPLKLGLSELGRHDDARCIIVVELENGDDMLTVGIMVDEVQEVLELADDMIEPPPRIMTQMDSRFISGMGKIDTEFVILLDLDRIFSEDELESMHCATESSDAQPEMLVEA